jgi:UDP-3-O-[3-hydroxymyristoyl] glucosamine N-acyltransferase
MVAQIVRIRRPREAAALLRGTRRPMRRSVDGFVEIHSGVVILPRVTIGVRDGTLRGPTIRRDARIGSGAKLLGPRTVHRGARIGADADPRVATAVSATSTGTICSKAG